MALYIKNDSCSKLRNGRPARLAARMHVKHGVFSLRKARFGKLSGEVLTIYKSENGKIKESLDIAHARVKYADRKQKRSIRIVTPQRTLTLSFAAREEAKMWAKNLRFAAKHRFNNCYRLEELLVRSTGSRIYSCRALDTNEEFIVEVIKKDEKKRHAMECLQREGHVNGAFNHINIVKAVDMFSTRERDFTVFEYMRGGSMADILDKWEKLPESIACTVMRQIFNGLHYMHSNQVVHSKIEPNNVFCSTDRLPTRIAIGNVRLAMFLHENHVVADVQKSKAVVTPYTSAEIINGERYGPAADMWSAGVMLYELLSGELPFKGLTDQETSKKVRPGAVKFEGSQWDNISDSAKSLIRQLLHIGPCRRISALASLQHPWITETKTTRKLAGSSAPLEAISGSHVGVSERQTLRKTVGAGQGQLLKNVQRPSILKAPHVWSSAVSQSQSRHGSSAAAERCRKKVSFGSVQVIPPRSCTPYSKPIAKTESPA